MVYNVENAERVIETQLDLSDNFLVVPVGKLDADQYVAEDIDGVTESIFGSGNLGFGILQASQTDSTLNLTDPFEFAFGQGGDIVGVSPVGFSFNDTRDDSDVALDAARDIGQNNFNFPATDNGADGNFVSSAIGSSAASQLASDAGAFNAETLGLNIGSGIDGSNGNAGLDGNDGNTPIAVDGSDGADGQNAVGEGGKTINIDFGDKIINFGDLNLNIDNSVDIIEGLMLDLGDSLTVLTAEITNITNILGDVVTNLDIFNLSNIPSLVSNITNELNLNIDNTVTEISNITNNVTNILNNLLDGKEGSNLDLDLDINILNMLTGQVTVPLNNILDADINLNSNLDPSYAVFQNVADLTGISGLNNIIGDLGAAFNGLQNTVNQTTNIVSDLDINDFGSIKNDIQQSLENLYTTLEGLNNTVDEALGGLLGSLGQDDNMPGDGNDGLISQTVDPVVNDTGNIIDDVTGDATANATDKVDAIIDDITDVADNLTTDITDNLLGTDNDNEAGNDSDVVADLGLNIIDESIVDEVVEIAIDPVEDLVGDIDLEVALDTDLLNSDSEIDNYAGDQDITADTGIDLVDSTVAEVVADIPLDPVEKVVGDVDLNIDAAVDILHDLADPIVNDGEGGTGDDTLLSDFGGILGGTVDSLLSGNSDNSLINDGWTECTIQGDGLFDDLINGLGETGDVLPEPSGTVAEGLGVLNVEPEIDVGSLGGLFG